MPDPLAAIRGFLENWKPYATLPADDPLRREILAFLEARDPAARQEMLARLNTLYRLHRIYGELGILREGESAKVAIFSQLIALSAAEFAEAIRGQRQKPFLTLLLEGFEFERAAAAPNQLAARQFLAHFWTLRVGDPPLKYGIYPNGVLFSSGGKSHDELAREFTKRGMGSGMPVGGGFMARQATLAYAYDTHSQFMKSGDPRALVAESLRRWIRLSGGDEGKVQISYTERLG
jgi:hypothetical protein